MKKLFKNQWFIGISCSVIASLLYSLGQNHLSIPFLNKFLGFEFSFKVKVWEVLLLILILFLIKYLYSKVKQEKLNFLNYKSDNWSKIDWVWEWKLNDNKRYEISNLNMLCPNCNNGVFSVSSMYSSDYNCVKCGYSTAIKFYNKPSHSQIKGEIFNHIRKEFSQEIKHIDLNE